MNKNLKSIELFLNLGLITTIRVSTTPSVDAIDQNSVNSLWQVEQNFFGTYVLLNGDEGSEG